MEGDDDILPNALSAMSIDDGPSRRAGIASLNNNEGRSSDSLAGVVDGERYVGGLQSSSSDHHNPKNNNNRQHAQDNPITSPPSHPQSSNDRPSSAEMPPQNNSIAAAGTASSSQQQQQQPQITIDDIPPEMREAFTQLDPDQQALALEMLAQQKLEQQQQMEEEMSRPDEHFLTIALNGKRHYITRVCVHMAYVVLECWTTFLIFLFLFPLSLFVKGRSLEQQKWLRGFPQVVYS